MYESFWSTSPITEAHIIKSSSSNDHGKDVIYHAYCEEEMKTFQQFISSRYKLGTLEDAVKDGAKICEKCLKLEYQSNDDY